MGGKRRLLGGVPRAYEDHRRLVAVGYRRYVEALLLRLPGLPPAASPTLREAGVVSVELEQMTIEAQALADRPQRRADLRRIERRRIILRSQLRALERRLEELSDGHAPLDLARAIQNSQANGNPA